MKSNRRYILVIPSTAVLVGMLLIQPCLGQQKEKKIAPKVVNGFTCDPMSVPYLAVLLTVHEYRSYCGASVLSSTWILTAAHCCLAPPETYTIYTGLSNFRQSQVQEAKIKRIVSHDDFDIDPWSTDICLIELQTPIKENLYTTYVHIPSESVYNNLMEEQRCNMSLSLGFGLRNVQYENGTSAPEIYDSSLQCVFQRIMTDDYCDIDNEGLIDIKTIMCTHGYPNISADTCQGDSGGPLICQGMQVGIVAAGRGCGLGYRSYYTKVAMFYDFIKKYVPLGYTRKRSLPSSALNLRYATSLNYLIYCASIYTLL